uniref:Uncharacterized protein n=1 Tax=Urocitellus parryii TaxID=9999 RepID=A0A8D2HJR3_UROPR
YFPYWRNYVYLATAGLNCTPLSQICAKALKDAPQTEFKANAKKTLVKICMRADIMAD